MNEVLRTWIAYVSATAITVGSMLLCAAYFETRKYMDENPNATLIEGIKHGITGVYEDLLKTYNSSEIEPE